MTYSQTWVRFQSLMRFINKETLMRHQAVLEHQRDILNEIYFQHPEDPFVPELRIAKTVWEDMGYPETVTITVESGDRLNEDYA